MSRYTGPTFKKARRYNFSILENGKEFSKGKQRKYVPGQHGPNARIKLSDYGLHLHAKQKIKYVYGLNEKQLKNSFKKASKNKGVIGTIFLQLLESRLDNVVYRMGFTKTRRQSRQFVNHGHFLLNGKKANIPSIILKEGDKIQLKEKSKNNAEITQNIKENTPADWITLDLEKMEGTFDRKPERRQLNPNFSESLVVEYYNK